MVSANHWLRAIKTYKLLWYLTWVSANHASSNWAQDDSGNVTKVSSQHTILKECQYNLIRTYWVHTSNPDFKRRVAELEDSSGNLSPLVMLQYIYSGDPDDIEIKPHGGAKKNPRPFFSTAPGTRTKISDKASSSLGPSSIYDELYQEAGTLYLEKHLLLFPEA